MVAPKKAPSKAAQVAPDAADQVKTSPDPVPDADSQTDPAPDAGDHTAAASPHMVDVIVLHEFNDLAEGARRHVGDRISITDERAAEILDTHNPALICIVGDAHE
ncbi:hypothetical protein [Adlercreutzia mucosicola]|uniref:hypothetical protein n=1 Tax=Adlercreutzia mucosicola TaxID=580026 RepID=UPI0003F6F7CB|nr:hypothetical protein [Adlercreutzia mucosicola]MCR2034152.1 hypothetical protein [Adlercreutzia mucosicola]